MMRQALIVAGLATLMSCKQSETVTGGYYMDYHGGRLTICDEARSTWALADTQIAAAYERLALPLNEQVLLRVEGTRQDPAELRNLAGSGAVPQFYVQRVLEMR